MLLHAAWVPPEWQLDPDAPRGRWVSEKKKWIAQVVDDWGNPPASKGYLFVWAEVGRIYTRVSSDQRLISLRSVTGPAGRRQYVSASLRITRHPFQASARKVRETVGDLMNWSTYLPWADALLWLPSNEQSPLPSPELAWQLRSIPQESQESRNQLRLWLVQGVMLTPDVISQFLNGLSKRLQVGAAGQFDGIGIGYGEDLRYWYEVTHRWLNARRNNKTSFLTAHEPSVREPNALTLGRRFPWAAGAAIDPGTAESIEQIALQLGPWYTSSIGAIGLLLNRGYLPASMLGHLPVPLAPPAVQIGTALSSFFLLTDPDWAPSIYGRDGPMLNGHGDGVGSAVGTTPGRVSPSELEQAQAQEPLALRLYVRLVPPGKRWGRTTVGEEPAPGHYSRPTTPAASWHLVYGLQAREDPSLLLRAADLWRASDQAAVVRTASGPRRLQQPQERLLADLATAARLFAPIARSLGQSRPEGTALTDEEAWQFLTHTAAQLQQAGFQVLLPAEVLSGPERTRLGLTLLLGERQQAARIFAPAPVKSPSWFGPTELAQFDWRVSLGDEALTEAEFAALSRAKIPLIQLRGRWLQLTPEELKVLRDAWQERQQGALSPSQLLRRVLEQAATVAHPAVAGDSTPLANGAGPDAGGRPTPSPASTTPTSGLTWRVEANAAWKQLLAAVGYQVTDGRLVDRSAAARWPTDTSVSTDTTRPVELSQPADFVGQLRPYQRRGVTWMDSLLNWGLGACLADDMGLGKTIQVIALLLSRRERGLIQGPALIVCPTSVVGNWRQELQRFAPSLRVYVHHGANRRRQEDLVRYVAGRAADPAPDVVVTSYPLAARDRSDLVRVHWDTVLLDEAQMIKNAGTKQSRAVRALPGRHRLTLTGTPLENRLEELWSIYDFLNPGYLGSQEEFRRRFALPVEQHQDEAALRRLRFLVKPFLLRRIKADPTILPDLPDKQEAKVFCTLTREQATLYQAVVDQTLATLAGLDRGIRRRGAVLAALTRLKLICDHPSLFLRDAGRSKTRSGKLRRLVELLQEVIAEGDSALVFTQFARMGEILRNELTKEFHAPVWFLYGGVPRNEREEMVAGFQQATGPSIFVLSLKAGGLGLNLTKAAYVFHYDRWWNPAVEDQATDRAYRIGQRQNVMVHKFVCQGTLEERIDQLIEEKRQLRDQIVGAGEAWLTEMSTDELRSLLRLGEEAVEGDE